jgi:hypothetical protein
VQKLKHENDELRVKVMQTANNKNNNNNNKARPDKQHKHDKKQTDKSKNTKKKKKERQKQPYQQTPRGLNSPPPGVSALRTLLGMPEAAVVVVILPPGE